MIKFHDLPADERAQKKLISEMTAAGYSDEDAQRITDAACGIVIATMRGLDEKICSAVSDPEDRTVVQSLVLHQMAGICHKGLEVNAVQHFMGMLRRFM